ncbi:VirB3 family type IV secretion system protein [Escherichia coli]
MTILNKALTRPAALWGVPLVPLLFTLCILTLGGRLVTFLLASPASHTCLYRAETAGKRGHSFL